MLWARGKEENKEKIQHGMVQNVLLPLVLVMKDRETEIFLFVLVIGLCALASMIPDWLLSK